jgi:hypothetical protein
MKNVNVEVNAANVLGESVVKATEAWHKKETAAKNSAATMADAHLARGIPESAYTEPKGPDAAEQRIALKDGTCWTHLDLYTALKSIYFGTLTKTQRELLATPPKALPPHKKDERRNLITASGTFMRDMKAALARRVKALEPNKVDKSAAAAEGEGEGETGETSKSSPQVKIGERLIAAMKLAQKDESPTYDLKRLIIALTAALQAVGAEMPKD